MRDGTWRCARSSDNGLTYSPDGGREHLSYARFLRRNASREVREELDKFEHLLLHTNVSFGGMGGAPRPTVDEVPDDGKRLNADEEHDDLECDYMEFNNGEYNGGAEYYGFDVGDRSDDADECLDA